MLVDGAVPWRFRNAPEFLCYVMLACMTATCALQLRGLPVNHSLAFVVVLSAIASLPLPEMLVIGAVAIVVQTLWNRRTQPEAARGLPLFGGNAIAMVTAHSFRESDWLTAKHSAELTALSTATVFLMVYTAVIAGAVALRERRSVLSCSRSWLAGALPCYVPGAFFAAFIAQCSPAVDWIATLTLLTPLFLIYWTYRQVVDGWATPLYAARSPARSPGSE